MGSPSDRSYLCIIEFNPLYNCPTRTYDIRNARKIFDPGIGSLKGNTTHNNSTRVELDETQILPSISEQFQFVAICFDIMFVKNIPFAVSKSARINFSAGAIHPKLLIV